MASVGHVAVGLAAARMYQPGRVSRDLVRERIVEVLLREHTAYTDAYSESAFNTIAPGQSQRDVRARLGAPFGESWVYLRSSERTADMSAASISGCASLRFERDAVTAAFDPAACAGRGITAGMSAGDVRQRLGQPTESCWQYTSSPRGGHYRVRMVRFMGSIVDDVVRGWR